MSKYLQLRLMMADIDPYNIHPIPKTPSHTQVEEKVRKNEVNIHWKTLPPWANEWDFVLWEEVSCSQGLLWSLGRH